MLPILLSVVLGGVMSCSEKLFVVSDKNAYHVGSNRVYKIPCDSSLLMFTHFKLTKTEYKKITESADRPVRKDSLFLRR